MQHRRGFTLIELLVTVVIIGALSAIALPKLSNSKKRVVLATLKSDLRNLMTAQEMYFADHTTYTADRAELKHNLSTSVSITISDVTETGWKGEARHATSDDVCVIAIGAPADALGIRPGEPACEEAAASP